MPSAWRLWSYVAALAALTLAACATAFDNAPLNAPIAPGFVTQSALPPPPDPSGGENLIALSLSGGGMRAAAFAFGGLQALQGGGPPGMDVFDDLTFISSVSGGSLTAA